MTENQTTYDEVPYKSHAFVQSHPDRLATIGRLFGMNPPPVTKCRVIELGCASGGNLIPMAFQLPESKFVGVELSGRQVEMARDTIQELNLKNIRIEHASISDIDSSWGVFDYIISHGVYSWVPEDVQHKILSIASENLASHGIAYVSYNTYPGWHIREIFRNMMRFHSMQFPEAEQQIQQAKAMIDFLMNSLPAEKNPYGGALFKSTIDRIKSGDNSYLFHEYLEEVNTPTYFYQFASRVDKYGLQYLGEADFPSMFFNDFPKDLAKMLHTISRKNIVYTEQYMDFFRSRAFRQTLLCHKDQILRRNPDPERVSRMRVRIAPNLVSSHKLPDLWPGGIQSFHTDKGVIKTDQHLIRAGLAVLREYWPRAINFDTLFRDVIRRSETEKQPDPRAVVKAMIQCHAMGMTEFRTWQGEFVTTLSRKPKASSLAVYQCRKGLKFVVNMCHENVQLDDFSRQMLPILDGTRDQATQITRLAEFVKEGRLAVRQKGQAVTNPRIIRNVLEKLSERTLSKLAGNALLVE